MKCSNCNSCNSCNNDGCYYCVDYGWTGEKYVCTCEDGEKCANRKLGDCK